MRILVSNVKEHSWLASSGELSRAVHILVKSEDLGLENLNVNFPFP